MSFEISLNDHLACHATVNSDGYSPDASSEWDCCVHLETALQEYMGG